jgi:MFS family permease
MTTGRRAPYLALLTANTVSLAGTGMTLLAVPWFVLDTTGQAALAGLVGGALALPQALGAVFGGPLVDRMSPRRASVVSDVVSAAVFAAIPMLHLLGLLAVETLLVLVFAGGMAGTLGATARRALIPDVAGAAGLALERANASIQTWQRLAALVGAGLGGVLITQLSAPGVLVVDAASFLLSAALIMVAVAGGERHRGRERYLAELGEGLRWLLAHRALRMVVLLAMGINLLDGPMSVVLLPLYASQDPHGPVALGLLVGAFGVASLAGSALYGAWYRRLPTHPLLYVTFAAIGLSRVILALVPPLPVAMAAVAISGFLSAPFNPVAMTLMQREVPVRLRGRVFGVVIGLAVATLPLGAVLGGALTAWLGFVQVLVIIAGVSFALAGLAALAPSLRLAVRDTRPEDVLRDDSAGVGDNTDRTGSDRAAG